MANPNLNNLSNISGGAASLTLTTGYQTLITAQSDTVYKINSILISTCTTGTGDTVTVKIGTNPYVIKTLPINTFIDFVINKPLYLLEGNTLEIKKAGDSGSEPIYCTASYEVLS